MNQHNYYNYIFIDYSIKLIYDTVITSVFVSIAPCGSVAINITLLDPTLALTGVPASVAVPLPLSVNVNQDGMEEVVVIAMSPVSISLVVTLNVYAVLLVAALVRGDVITVHHLHWQ